MVLFCKFYQWKLLVVLFFCIIAGSRFLLEIGFVYGFWWLMVCTYVKELKNKKYNLVKFILLFSITFIIVRNFLNKMFHFTQLTYNYIDNFGIFWWIRLNSINKDCPTCMRIVRIDLKDLHTLYSNPISAFCYRRWPL